MYMEIVCHVMKALTLQVEELVAQRCVVLLVQRLADEEGQLVSVLAQRGHSDCSLSFCFMCSCIH